MIINAGIKLNHVSKMGHWRLSASADMVSSYFRGEYSITYIRRFNM